MKRFYSLFAAFSCFGATVLADPIPLFQNFGVITNAIPIDALAFDNQGIFSVTRGVPENRPYDMQNVINFTNANLMTSVVGFQFDTITDDGWRKPANSFVNSGTIQSSGFPGNLLVNAKEINGRNGLFQVSSPGLLRLTGGDTDLTRGGLVAGDPFSSFGGGWGNYRKIEGTNYYEPASDLVEVYGGAGPQTNDLSTQFNFKLPDGVMSPSHRIYSPAYGTNGASIIIPNSFMSGFDAFANESTNSDGSKVVQVVFVNTNFVATNISASVTFAPKFTGESLNPNPNLVDTSVPAVIVRFISTSYDPISGDMLSNVVNFVDTSAMQTNLVMFTNRFDRSYVKPSSYEVSTAVIDDLKLGAPGNTLYTNSLIYDAAVNVSNKVAGFYGAYGVQVGANYSPVSIDTQVNPTNRSPRIEVKSDNLDLTLTRMRSEGPILLETKHLISDEGADISASLLQADIGSTNGLLRIEKLFPTNFQRLSGEIDGYTFIWENQEITPDATNNVKYHVLIVDQEFTSNIEPSIDQAILHATNLIIENDMKLDRVAKFDSQNLTVNSVIQFNNFNVVSTNLIGLKNLTVDTNGILAGANTLSVGFDTAGLDSIINRGQISAVAALFKAGTFVNSGTIGNGTNLFRTDDSIVIQSRSTALAGGALSADHLIEIDTGDLVATNSSIVAGGLDFLGNQMYGRLVLNVTNLISDFGEGASNVWEVSDGFDLRRKPASGDLLGTEIRTIATDTRLVTHRWAGQDAGPGPDGFVNNVTLGHLILDIRSARAKLRFTGTGTQNALYVKTLDFELDPSIDINTDLNTLLQIDSNLKIYFNNSNAGDKLTTAFPDRVIQVPEFASDGPTAAMTVWVNGFGIVTPNLNGKLLKVGNTYKVKAKPGKGQVFAGWSGAVESSSPAVSFTMQPDQVLIANMAPNPFDNSANPVVGSYNGLFSDPAGVQQESSGFLSLKLSKKGSFTGKIISGKSHPFRGTFDPTTGRAQVSVQRPRQSALTLDLQLDLSNHTDQVTGTVSGDGWVANLIADRAGAGNIVEPGKYTLAFAGGAAPAPSGDSIGTLIVDAQGALRFKGTLADGTRVNQKVNLSKDGRWPLYATLYRGKGSLFSWITLTNSNDSAMTGDVAWLKQAAPGRNYQGGFTNISPVIGSPYSAQAPVLNFTQGVVTLSGGNLTAPLASDATLNSGNPYLTGTEGLRCNVSLPTGLLNGKFVHPDTKKGTTIRGVILQQQNTARGFFLDDATSGAFILESK